MEAVCLEPEGNLATTISQLIQATTETATTATTHSNNNHCSIKSKDVSTHAHCKLSEQKHHRAGSCGPVCLKYWTSPKTVRATYLLVKCLEERIIATYFLLPQHPIYLLLLLRQPICKSHSRCSSLLSLLFIEMNCSTSGQQIVIKSKP